MALLIHKEKTGRPPVSLQTALTDAVATLVPAGVDSPRLDAEVLMAGVLGISRSQLYTILNEHAGAKDLKRFHKLVYKRARRIPLQYITGHAEFMSLDFLMKKGILVPRPETELAVEAVLERADIKGRLNILDIGTGCGNIAVSVAVGLRDAGGLLAVYASDISSKALRLAALNAKRHGVAANISLHKGSIYEAFRGLGLGGEVDFIISNPPYVPQNELQHLQPEVRDYEDPRALVAGSDGLKCHMAIVEGAHNWLRPGGWLIMELGEDQAARVKDLVCCNEAHFKDMHTIRDLQNIERIIIARSR